MWAIQRGSPSCGKAARWEIWGIDPIATTGRERIFLSLTLLYIATGGIEPLPDPSLSNAFDWVEEYYRDKVVGQ
jgi:hypothetical protein